MVDTLTNADVDDIWSRVEQSIDLSRVRTRGQLESELLSKSRNWNRPLTDFMWNKHKSVNLKSRHLWSNREVGWVKSAYKLGWNKLKLAKKIGVTISSLYSKASRLGITKRR